MRYSNIALGAPEEALMAKICKEVTDFYGGLDSPNPYIFSSSKLPSQQSSAEKAATALYKALAGVRNFTVGGATASGVFSPEQLVIDCEIIGYVNRMMQGFEIGDPLEEMDIISEGIEREYYLDTISTATRHRSTYWRPRLFEHSTFRHWQENQPPDLKTRTKNIAREMIQKHDYWLDFDKLNAINKIYQEAESYFAAN
jgi:trimethylamine:corrinoid methyltransferase-like protein